MHPKQRGMTLIGWLLLMGLIGFFALLIIKLWPIYYENFAVKRAVNKLNEQAGIAQLSKDKIWESIIKQFYIDGVENIDKKESFSVEEDENDQRVVAIAYERRVNILANVDAVVVFEERVTLSNRE